MPKIRGYVDMRLMQEAIKQWPDLALIESTSAHIDFVFKKALKWTPTDTQKKDLGALRPRRPFPSFDRNR